MPPALLATKRSPKFSPPLPRTPIGPPAIAPPAILPIVPVSPNSDLAMLAPAPLVMTVTAIATTASRIAPKIPQRLRRAWGVGVVGLVSPMMLAGS